MKSFHKLLTTRSSLLRHFTTTVPHLDAFALLTNAAQLLQSHASPGEANAPCDHALKVLDEMLERSQHHFWQHSLSQFPLFRRKLLRVGKNMITLLLQNDCVDEALKVFDDMFLLDSKGDYRFRTEWNLVFDYVLCKGKKLGRKKIADIVLRFAEHEIFPSLLELRKLIVLLGENGESNVACDILQALKKLGFNIDKKRFNFLLIELGRVGDFTSVHALMAKMNALDIRPNAVTYGIVVKYLCRFERVDEAMELIQGMCEGGETNEFVDVITYNTLIDGFCKVGMPEKGLALMERMRLQEGRASDIITYNCLINGFCKAENVERGLKLFEEMTNDGVFPNVVTLNILLYGMCRLGQIDNAIQFFRKMQKQGLKGNADSYSILVDAACKTNNMKKALHIFYQMSRDDCSAAAIVCFKLVSCLSKDGRINDAVYVLSKLKSSGFRPSILCYNILIGNLCKLGELDKAYNLFKELKEVAVNPDVVTYNTLISYFSKAGNFEISNRLMWKMTKAGIAPTRVTYGALIHAYSLHDNVDGAMRVFENMCSTSDVLPTIVIYNHLISSLCKSNDVERALLLMDDMRAKRVKPNTTTYNAIFKGLRAKNLSNIALSLMDRMTEQACRCDSTTMEILTPWLSSGGEAKNLSNFVEQHRVFVSNA